ncbi:hypothetical protein HDU86_005979 [Geranomyces michiganensis]|nr:hypothetical protein HDU86_005979 [Geranomyces michiganensis]
MPKLPVETERVTAYVENQVLKRTFTAVGFAKYAHCKAPDEARIRILAAIRKFKEERWPKYQQETTRKPSTIKNIANFVDEYLKDKFDSEEAWLEYWSRYLTKTALRRSGRQQMTMHIQEETAALLDNRQHQSQTSIAAVVSDGDDDDGKKIVSDGDDDDGKMDSDDESYVAMSEETETETSKSRESTPPIAILSKLASNFEMSFSRRNAALDTPISENRTLESVLFAVGMQAADRECLAHSWIVDIGEDWVKSLLTDEEQASLQKLWIEGRTGASLLDDEDMTWFQECDVLARCDAELLEIEELFENMEEADPKTLYLHLATKPLIRDGEDPVRHEKVFGIRRILTEILHTWWRKGDIKPYNEAALFASMWAPVFDSLRARGFSMTAMDEPIPASKARKLLTYSSRKNVSGLQSDRAWVTKTGHAIVWGEGKKGTWVENNVKAEEARLKAKKGAKDCGDYTLARTGRNVETYASVWLGSDWELFCCVSLPSGVSIVGDVLQLTMPRAPEGFLLLTHLLRRVLAWLTVLERRGKELARPAAPAPPSGDNPSTRDALRFKLLASGREEVVESTAEVNGLLDKIATADQRLLRTHLEEPYWRMVLELYGAEVGEVFSGVQPEVVDKGLLPKGMMDVMKGRARWEA